MNAIADLQRGFNKAEGLFRLLLVNIIIFLAISAAKLIFFLSGTDNTGLQWFIEKLALGSDPGSWLLQPWSILTYMFVHEAFFHILFNMLVLYWFGQLFCEFMSSSRLVVVYLLGGISGGLLFMLAYQWIPAFQPISHSSHLVGASAAVIAVLTAIATLLPDYSMHLLFFGPVRLRYIAIFLVLLYLISIPDGNAGGNIAHLGGAIFGFVYIRLYRKGVDIGGWLEKLLFLLSGKRSHIRAVHRKQGPAGKEGGPRQEVIDAILDKISRSGYSSLSEQERETLFRASKGKGSN